MKEFLEAKKANPSLSYENFLENKIKQKEEKTRQDAKISQLEEKLIGNKGFPFTKPFSKDGR